ncbi:MAG: hypothetical protein QXR30_01405 [Candidatus Woesearchaeota archaeon]
MNALILTILIILSSLIGILLINKKFILFFVNSISSLFFLLIFSFLEIINVTPVMILISFLAGWIGLIMYYLLFLIFSI